LDEESQLSRPIQEALGDVIQPEILRREASMRKRKVLAARAVAFLLVVVVIGTVHTTRQRLG
tara:strand:+ start:85 stop:270 length:186 start_codon:yes stop_codon:yes gene_type:complete